MHRDNSGALNLLILDRNSSTTNDIQVASFITTGQALAAVAANYYSVTNCAAFNCSYRSRENFTTTS